MLLTWGAHNADIEVTAKVMQQLCYAHRADGGCTVVVLSCNSKLDMEGRFARVIPERERLGTRFVFRQVWGHAPHCYLSDSSICSV